MMFIGGAFVVSISVYMYIVEPAKPGVVVVPIATVVPEKDNESLEEEGVGQSPRACRW
jgi:hypothetical protein